METFKDLIDKKLKSARPLSTGVGLFRPDPTRPRLHQQELPDDFLVNYRAQEEGAEKTSESEALEQLADNLETLKVKARGIEKQLQSRPWLGQALDCLCVWGLFLLFPLTTKVVLSPLNTEALISPSVVFLFAIFYFIMLSGYLWAFNYFHTPTPGMLYQNMKVWPSHWKWSANKLTPAFKRALGHLLLDDLWRKR